MQKLSTPNVKRPADFKDTFYQVVTSMHQVFELAKQHHLPPTVNGCMVYDEETGMDGSQVARQFDRPDEFLQSLFDLLRVEFEPWSMGSFLLNANLDFIFEHMPDSPFELGYVSLVSDRDQSFKSFWTHDVAPYLTSLHYDNETSIANFVVCSTGPERYGMSLISEVDEVLETCFSGDEVLGHFNEAIDGVAPTIEKQNFGGYCVVDSLGARVRLSMWLLLPSPRANAES